MTTICIQTDLALAHRAALVHPDRLPWLRLNSVERYAEVILLPRYGPTATIPPDTSVPLLAIHPLAGDLLDEALRTKRVQQHLTTAADTYCSIGVIGVMPEPGIALMKFAAQMAIEEAELYMLRERDASTWLMEQAFADRDAMMAAGDFGDKLLAMRREAMCQGVRLLHAEQALFNFLTTRIRAA